MHTLQDLDLTMDSFSSAAIIASWSQAFHVVPYPRRSNQGFSNRLRKSAIDESIFPNTLCLQSLVFRKDRKVPNHAKTTLPTSFKVCKEPYLNDVDKI